MYTNREMQQPWLDEIYQLVSKGDIHDAIDLFFEADEEVLNKDGLDRFNAILEDLDPHQLGADLIVAFLTLANFAKEERLSNREKFVEKAENWFKLHMPQRASEALRGLT